MKLKLAIALIAMTLPLAGCGNKGPLVLAEPPPPVEDPVTAPGEVPVEIAPDTTVVEPGQVPTSELEPVDPTATPELPIDPATVPDSEADPATDPAEDPVVDPVEPPDATND